MDKTKAKIPGFNDNVCQNCVRAYPDWLTPRFSWLEVVGQYNGMLCPTCFLIRAAEKTDLFFYLIPVENSDNALYEIKKPL